MRVALAERCTSVIGPQSPDPVGVSASEVLAPATAAAAAAAAASGPQCVDRWLRRNLYRRWCLHVRRARRARSGERLGAAQGHKVAAACSMLAQRRRVSARFEPGYMVSGIMVLSILYSFSLLSAIEQRSEVDRPCADARPCRSLSRVSTCYFEAVSRSQ
jgi:hypothetical protein